MDYIDPAVAIPLAIIFWGAFGFSVIKPYLNTFNKKEDA